MKRPRHNLLYRNLATRTGICSICGPVPLHSNGAGRQLRCGIACKLNKRSPTRWETPKARAEYIKGKGPYYDICGTIPEDKLCVDHCHSSNKPRGVLCQRCNLAIGLLGENVSTLRSAIAYLEHNAGNPDTLV